MTRYHAHPVPSRSLFRVLATAAVEGAAFLFVLAVLVFGLWLVAP